MTAHFMRDATLALCLASAFGCSPSDEIGLPGIDERALLVQVEASADVVLLVEEQVGVLA